MRKIAIFTGYGGFTISKRAVEYLKAHGIENPVHVEEYDHEDYMLAHPFNKERDNPVLIQCIETLGDKAGEHLKVVEIPDDVEWMVCDSEGGTEWVAEKHRTWF